MEFYDSIHLACHAHQDLKDPSESRYFLHEGILDVEAIRKGHLKRKGLAFLSACRTTSGDNSLPDEAIHLASCMLTVGYSGVTVIETVWSVMDEDAPFAVDKVYGEILKDGEKASAMRALHRATLVLREMSL